MPATRPATISELAAIAQSDPDTTNNLELKHYLKRAETHRKAGQALVNRTTKGGAAGGNAGAGGGGNTGGAADVGLDLERAFIEYARAATLILEKIPSHRDYGTGLTTEQRNNLTLVS
ncbi:hypothetical protein B0H16DRAFT_1319223, partial [Mycena metata]